MVTQFQFTSQESGIAQSNAENFYRANKRTRNTVRKNGKKITIGDSEIDLIRSLSEFNLLESADSVEFHLWDDTRPDVIIHTNYKIPNKPRPVSNDNIQRYNDINYWLDALRSKQINDRKKALRAIKAHPDNFTENISILVPTLIDALKDPNLTNIAGQAINNIVDQRLEAVHSYIDRIESIQQDDNALVSRQASELVEKLNNSKLDKHTSSLNSKDQTDSEVAVEKKDRQTREQEIAVRSRSFTHKVKNYYNYECAICGKKRYTPDGNPEVEAAHIKPVSDSGPDSVSNGISLCKLHHWAFDNGWIAIDDEYIIKICDTPDVAGYDDFIQYSNKKMSLPDKKCHHPKQKYLKYHRQMHGFK